MLEENLKNKIVLVTGASAGIGEACARRFGAAGARLILVARREERLSKLASELPVESYLLPLDVRDRAAVEAGLGSLPENWQAIDILVNNAGLSRGLDRTHEGDPTDWDEMVDTNIKGLLYVSRAIIPGMVARGGGHVINIGSIAGREVYPAGNVYCATKHAVGAITKGMRIDLVDSAVKVTTVDPGLVETEFSLVRFHGDAERARQAYKGIRPLTGDDVADAVIWAASRPQHVQIAEVLLFSSDQASSMHIHRDGE
ncbi:MAG: SDR family oxidoreductase [candidate division Zixibacteria bacterium]|nr:SDR family oxidoreductase [candidate division Zixibacteria bacterium]